jgi:hypothetical protein
MGAWDQSKLEKETRIAQRSAGDGRGPVSLKGVRQSGNPAFLTGIRRSIEKREAILGFNQKPEGGDLSSTHLYAFIGFLPVSVRLVHACARFLHGLCMTIVEAQAVLPQALISFTAILCRLFGQMSARVGRVSPRDWKQMTYAPERACRGGPRQQKSPRLLHTQPQKMGFSSGGCRGRTSFLCLFARPFSPVPRLRGCPPSSAPFRPCCPARTLQGCRRAARMNPQHALVPRLRLGTHCPQAPPAYHGPQSLTTSIDPGLRVSFSIAFVKSQDLASGPHS